VGITTGSTAEVPERRTCDMRLGGGIGGVDDDDDDDDDGDDNNNINNNNLSLFTF
jgi:hypothetical protein